MKTVNWRNFDFLLLGAVAVLTIFGITMIRSAVAGNIELLELNLVGRQTIFAIAGFIVIIITSMIDYHFWSSISRTLYIGMAVFLAVLFTAGAVFFGSARWFDTGVILIQPSELAKIVIILVLAHFFSVHKSEILDLKLVGRSFLLTLGIVIWIILQPNLSTSIVILVLWFALLWAAGLQLKHLMMFIGLGVLAPVVSYPFLEEYQQRRIINFLFPDPEARHGDIYNVQQALISIGSGGWFGQGYGHGTQVQLRFLKVRHSDFIFSAMAEEFGFIGTVIVLALLLFVIMRCLRAARIAKDSFGALIAFGVATLLAFQTIVNIGVNLNLLPATGLTMPFVSYGGSSLLSTLLGIGLVESVVLRYKTLEF
ncbi:MAG: rod shape-determining protein RodA [Anaerolineales bacterium]|nr:rod shape-determining protein RodA [Anaerolineales bacterium]